MNLACSTIRLVGNVYITFIESINLFNHLFQTCIVDAVQTDPRMCLVMRSAGGNRDIDGLNQHPLVLDRERILAGLFSSRGDNSNSNHNDSNDEVQKSKIMSQMKSSFIRF